MRYYRLSYFLVFAVAITACKKGVVTSTTTDTYQEDLSALRPTLEKPSDPIATESIESTDTPTGNQGKSLALTVELDSVNRIITKRNSEKKFVDGYTIQIYTGNDDKAANEAKDHVEIMFPNLEPIISYNQPTFKVKVGSYYNRLEAHKIFESLKEDFPYALLIPERIAIKHE